MNDTVTVLREGKECDCILCLLFTYNPLWSLSEIVGEA